MLLASCGGNQEEKQSELELSEARMRLKVQTETVYQLDQKVLQLMKALEANAGASQSLASQRVEQSGYLTQLRSKKEVALERLETVKEPQFLRSQEERESDIEEAASAVHALSEQIIDAELVLSQMRHKQQELDSKRFSLSAELDKVKMDLAQAKEQLPAIEKRVSTLEAAQEKAGLSEKNPEE